MLAGQGKDPLNGPLLGVCSGGLFLADFLIRGLLRPSELKRSSRSVKTVSGVC